MLKIFSRGNIYRFLRKASVLAQNTTTVFLLGFSSSVLLLNIFYGMLTSQWVEGDTALPSLFGCFLSIFFFRPKGPIVLRVMAVTTLEVFIAWVYFAGSSPLDLNDILTGLLILLLPVCSIPAVVFNEK